MTAYRLAGNSAECRGSGDRWLSSSSNLAVLDETGRIVAWYERKKTFRVVETRVQFRRPDGTWETRYRVPAGSPARTLRDWFLAEIAERYGISKNG